MKIGFDGKRYVNNPTGLGEYSRNIVNALVDFESQNEYYLFANNNPISTKSGLKIVNYPKSFFFRTYGLGKLIKKNSIDIYHGLSNEIPLDIKTGTKTVCTIHDVIFKHFPSYYSMVDRQIYNLKTKYALNKADKIIATSHTTKLDLEQLFAVKESKIEVVYQPIHPLFYDQLQLQHYKLNETKPYLLYLSTFNSRKNHLRLIESFAKIHKQVDYSLILAGSLGETFVLCKKRISDLGLSNKIQIKTDVQMDAKMQLLVNASGFIYPSLYEGFGIPLLEAAACNLPIMASNIAVFKELGENSISYFNPYEINEIADALLDFQIEKRNSRNEILLSKVNRQKIATQLNSTYSSIL